MGSSQGAFVGYLTIYYFNSPFRKPLPGIVARICQALVLPPFQRKGYGRLLVEKAYELCRDDTNTVEVTVEDPCPAFVRLRNDVDYKLFVEEGLGMLGSPHNVRDKFDAMPEREIERLATGMKITKGQVRIVYEGWKFGGVPPPLTAGVEHENEKRFRLMVKRRLSKQMASEIEAYAGGDSKKKKNFLKEEYGYLEKQYVAIARKTRP